jgi:4'-phosphopantetheinyl transferase
MTLWPAPPTTPSLPPDEVHLWRFPLDASPDDFTTLQALLTADELLRAARLLAPHKARAFIVGRGRLRQILGAYRQCDPAALVFANGANGKPALAGSSLHFNLSHSGAWGVLVLSASAAVGVDIEKIDPALDYAGLAKRFFSAAEQAHLLVAPEERRRRDFYRLWTRKEALLKGQGRGFALSAGTEERGWQLRSFWVASGYVGTVAWAGEIQGVRRWQVAEEK